MTNVENIQIWYLSLKGKGKEENRPVEPGDKSFSALVTALQLLSLGLGGLGLEMGWQGLYQQPKRNNLLLSDFKFRTKHLLRGSMNGKKVGC